MLKEGTKAPDFESELDDGQLFHLASLRGRKNVVLYFYPKDFTAGCTREACSFQVNYEAIKQFDAVIVGISPDSLESHRSFRERYSLEFPLIADPRKQIVKAYDAQGFLSLIARVTYVIDKEGTIRSVIRHDLAIGRHLSDVLTALERIETEASSADQSRGT
ncbi:MAG: redoxin domain-containing protein [Dehalococcoidia bacterium]|nr:redoxin domain-containing protein [Dehalococcoidia bacterium]